MAQSKKGKLNYRCPSCFIRDIDIDMFYDEEKREYYCLRCCFHGSEEEVLRLNDMLKFRYKWMEKRVLDFGDDDKAPKVEDYKGEEEK